MVIRVPIPAKGPRLGEGEAFRWARTAGFDEAKRVHWASEVGLSDREELDTWDWR